MLIEPKLDEVAEDVVPGEYKVRVTGCQDGEYKTGTKYLNWRMETFSEEEPKNNGRAIFYKTIYEGRGAFQIQRFYKAATGEPLKGSFDTEQVIGKEIGVVVDYATDRDGNELSMVEVKSVKKLA